MLRVLKIISRDLRCYYLRPDGSGMHQYASHAHHTRQDDHTFPTICSVHNRFLEHKFTFSTSHE